MKKLFIDDLRTPPDSSWALVRDTADAIIYVKTNGCPDYFSFDYCLAGGKNILPFIHWLIEQDQKQSGFIPKNFQFDAHSSSMFGAEQIDFLLGGYLKSRK